LNRDLQHKKASLEKHLADYGSLLVAFSGGIDSTLLLSEAKSVLGDHLIAAIYTSPIHSKRETEAAIQMAKNLGVSYKLIESGEIVPPELIRNNRDRCYHCKKMLGEKLRELAQTLNIDAIAHGANLDDLDDFRPGFRAARETGMAAPLIDAGFTKSDIRALSKERGLSNWDKPAMPCLATRIPYNIPLSKELLEKIDRAESAILRLGFSTCRVRCHDTTARIELDPTELDRMLQHPFRHKIVGALREIGFHHIALDLEGYGQGKMNRDLDAE
jgi:uncharacterized protein